MNIKYRIKPRKKLVKEESIGVATDYNAGLSLKEIEIKYNITTSTIYRILNQIIN